MTDQAPIQTRPDGSIDTAFYMERARQMRSAQAHKLTSSATAPRRRSAMFAALVALIAWPFAS